MYRSREMLVATAAAAPVRNDEPLAGNREVVQHLAGECVLNDGAYRHWNVNRSAVVTCALAALAVPAALRFMLGIEAEVQQSVVMNARYHDHIAAPAAVTAAGPTARHKLLAPECHAPVSAVAGLYGNDYFVDE